MVCVTSVSALQDNTYINLTTFVKSTWLIQPQILTATAANVAAPFPLSPQGHETGMELVRNKFQMELEKYINKSETSFHLADFYKLQHIFF